MSSDVPAQRIGVGDRAPDFVLVDAWGHVRSLAPGRETTPAVLAFFKVTCPTCRLAMPYLDRLFCRIEGKPIRFWGMAQEEKVEAHRFAVDLGIHFPLVLDIKPHRASSSFGFTHVPMIYLVEPDGRVSMVLEGFVRKEFEGLADHLGERLGIGPIALFQPDERVPLFQPG